MDQTIPTWGYKPDGSAEIFDLAPGEGLPEGWEASPTCIVDPAFATAEALTARSEGRVYIPPALAAAVADPASGALDELASSVAEIERLQAVISSGMAENERLIGEIQDAEAGLEAAAGEIVSLKALLTKAQEDGGFAVAERDEVLAKLDAVTADLTQARADLDSVTTPKAPAKGSK
ncbi:hypothetical protein [Methylobacterium sp. E-045]|uniref:hypothetical protein n=1 Tax=Methylobacterium sp. E-045 TaxID=2836575 RepID=UPI001FBA40C3|nr:hypothetical protein [Methylobacterium sp. E-045]MCJ2129222.1 hypothetical protein [Methylobacterium sp. E-045]